VHTRGIITYKRFIPTPKPQGQTVRRICLHLTTVLRESLSWRAELWGYGINVANVQWIMCRNSRFHPPDNSRKVTPQCISSRSNWHVNGFQVHRLCTRVVFVFANCLIHFISLVCKQFFFIKFMKQSPVEKLAFAQLVKRYPALYGTWKFITVFTGPLQLNLIPRQINPVHILTLYFLKISCNVFPLGDPSNHFPFRFTDWRFVCVSHLSHACCIVIRPKS
jgi:hypothetical protein